MTITSKVEKAEPKAAYPRLVEGSMTGTVILMTAPGVGVVVGHSTLSHVGFYPLGYRSEAWATDLKPFDGTVTLSNEGR
jgi:hypothetical protein